MTVTMAVAMAKSPCAPTPAASSPAVEAALKLWRGSGGPDHNSLFGFSMAVSTVPIPRPQEHGDGDRLGSQSQEQSETTPCSGQGPREDVGAVNLDVAGAGARAEGN